jgi:hypothetical protein
MEVPKEILVDITIHVKKDLVLRHTPNKKTLYYDTI